MSLASLSIRRPVLATVMSIVIVIFGIIGFFSLGVREFPSVDPPVITVSTSYTGANADIIETQITEPIEEAVNGIQGIKTLTSVSRDGRSTVTVEFDLGVDLEAAANDVRDKVSGAIGVLPVDAEPPIVSKADANSFPIIFLNIKSSNRSLLELTEIAEKTFKERVQTIPGVSEVNIWGSKRYAMRLWMDPAKLAAYSVTPLDVRNALQRENVELPSGSIEGANTELTVRTIGKLTSSEEFNDLIIKESGDRIIRFSDIGKAELGPENLRTVLKRDGIPMVGVVVVPRPGANQIEIVDEFYARVEHIKKDLPPDIELGVGFDNTKHIRASISEVVETIILAFILVILIIFLFLRDWRTFIIPVIVIPIALVGSFFIMYVSGFSINVLTLLGIVLSIGLVVDDAIIVLENIYTKIESGMEPLEAGLKGSAEIFFAVIATTLSLVAVFLPIIFIQGLTGKLFREFGFVLAGAVIISSFVALTLTPMLSTKILKRRETHGWFYRKTEKFFNNLTAGYSDLLEKFMKIKWLAFVVIILSFFAIWTINKNLPQELAPKEDRSAMMVFSTAQEGATFDYMENYMGELIATIDSNVPETAALITVTSPGFGASSSVNSGFARVMLVPPSERDRSQSAIVTDITQKINQIPGARAFVREEETIGGRSFGLPVQYVVQAPNLDKLKEIVPQFLGEAFKDTSTFAFVDVNLKFNKPEMEITIDREKARTLGVSVMDVAQTMQLALAGQRFSYFTMNGQQYQVIGQLEREDRNNPSDIRSLYVKNNQGQLIQLDNLISIEEQSTPPQLFRYNRFVSATFSAQLKDGKTIQQGIEAMDAVADKVLNDTYSTALDGASKEYEESSSSLFFAFGLALVLVFLILSAQFESFRDPLIIMFTVPLAVAGAFLALLYFDQSLNIFSQIGIIMLIGLVTKNGILIVEFANQRKAQGLKKLEAIQDAAVARFRPILMTSLSTMLGVLPIALALGAGSESRISMGIAIIGGLLFGTLLTLFVIPAVYYFLSEKDKDISNITEEENITEPAHLQ